MLVDDQGPAKLLGQSLMVGKHECGGLALMVFFEHHHFWPLLPVASRPTEDVVVSVSPDSVLSNRGAQILERDLDYDEVEPNEVAIGCREQELQLCEALAEWPPFDLPSPKLIECCKTLGCIYV